MTNLEMVEKLREKANVSYAEAKAALETNNWDILDAMVMLEEEGKAKPLGGSYSTKHGAGEDKHINKERVGSAMKRFMAWLDKIVKLGSRNELVVSNRKERLFGIPVLAFVLLLIFGFWVVIPLMIVGLFCGLKFSFAGPDLGKEKINSVMNKASAFAETIKDDIKSECKDDNYDE